jgi:dCMP deaminase
MKFGRDKMEAKLNRYDKAYLGLLLNGGLSYCIETKQVGAIIVRDRMIISDGYNGTPTGFETAARTMKD